ncbi:MAG: transaldolase family protein [Nitrospinae bacterium]|nr:transaldolase family protein [Nitrospinota bacterium]
MGEITQEELSKVTHRLALEGFKGSGAKKYGNNDICQKLRETGSNLWMDTGNKEAAEEVWTDEFSALTTNNTLANQVVQTGIMDEEIKKTVSVLRNTFPGIDDETLAIEIGFVINCKIALRLIENFGVKVSVELHPHFARDIENTLAYARRYIAVCPEYFIIKIPLTPEGYLAVRKLTAEGIPINFTLGFSARQNYLAAALSNPDYVNVFLGRLNSVVADNGLGNGDNVGEKVTWATQNSLNQLKKSNNNIHTKLIAASIRGGEQVFKLAGIDCQTIPPAAAQSALQSGKKLDEIVKGETLVGEVGMNNPAQFEPLWTICDKFKNFIEELSNEFLDGYTGNDLINFCEKKEIDLFHRYTAEELMEIKADGKIPKLSKWEGSVALDDLMTYSALLSFVTDQEALDNRIKGFFS